nr:C-C motif chemokine 28 [Pogona vitticeps]
MNVSLLIIFGTTIACHASEAVFPIIFNCCTEVANQIPRRWLRRTVVKFEIQKAGDLCKIPAVVLYTKHKKLCASPQNKNVKRWMKQMVKRHQRTGHLERMRKKGKRRRKTWKKQCADC